MSLFENMKPMIPLKRVPFLLLIAISVLVVNCMNRKPVKSDNETMKSIYKVIEENDIQQIKELINSKTDLEIRNQDGETPLMNAIYEDREEIAILLMNAGANVNAQDKILNSPFLYAGAEGKLNLVKAALKHGADFNVFNRYGGSALIPAAEKGHLEVVKLLVNTPNFPINHINNLVWTALMEAIVLSDGGKVHTEIVKTLIDGGADVNIPDRDGISPLQHARKRKFTEIVKLLEDAGAR